jgi:ketosteroid isomerase-like protein
MSQANIEIAKATNAALNRGDLRAVLDSFAPDAEFKDLANGPDQATVVHGAAAMREVWGISVDVHQFDVYEFRDGKVVRATLGNKSKDEALRVAGHPG